MAEHEPGDKIASDNSEQRSKAVEIVNAAPIVDSPDNPGDKDEWRRIYGSEGHTAILRRNQPQRA